jgi:hypothetical protein
MTPRFRQERTMPSAQRGGCPVAAEDARRTAELTRLLKQRGDPIGCVILALASMFSPEIVELAVEELLTKRKSLL